MTAWQQQSLQKVHISYGKPQRAILADDDDDDDGCNGLNDVYSLGLHIGAIFVILAASLLGTIIPIVGKHVPALRLHPFVYAVGKSCATGVMMAVAMIHMINEAAGGFQASCVPESFKDRYEAWAFAFAMIAAILMHAIDLQITAIAESWMARRASESPRQGSESHAEGVESVVGGAPNVLESREPCQCACHIAEKTPGQVAATQDEAADLQCAGHSHDFAVPHDMPLVQRVVAALCMEFGVTLHSVFVGFAVGVAPDDTTKTLLIALVFHQLFEGLAMGARLADAEFKLSMEAILTLIFSFSAPIGIAVATGAVSASKDALSGTTYVMVSAIFNSLCGGILLYLSFTLMLLDFPADLRRHCSAGGSHPIIKRICLFLGLWVGAGVMALIGKWL